MGIPMFFSVCVCVCVYVHAHVSIRPVGLKIVMKELDVRTHT
jgi:hypothetical protein